MAPFAITRVARTAVAELAGRQKISPELVTGSGGERAHFGYPSGGLRDETVPVPHYADDDRTRHPFSHWEHEPMEDEPSVTGVDVMRSHPEEAASGPHIRPPK